MIVLDTEQTGNKDNQVCQIAYVKATNGTLIGFNEFYAVDSMNDYAAEITGLTVAKLEQLSGGRRFKSSAAGLLDSLSGDILVGHSVSCDLRVLRQEFGRCGFPFKPTAHFCTMNHFTRIMNIYTGQKRPKSPSLTELCEYLGITERLVTGLAGQLFDVQSKAHDARFDACATYLCVERAEKQGMIRGLVPERR